MSGYVCLCYVALTLAMLTFTERNMIFIKVMTMLAGIDYIPTPETQVRTHRSLIPVLSTYSNIHLAAFFYTK